MRGNRKLIQSIAVAGMTGVLALTATFSQPQIIRTQGTVQIEQNGTAGIIAAFAQNEQMGDALTRAVTVEKNDTVVVAAANVVTAVQSTEKKAAEKQPEEKKEKVSKNRTAAKSAAAKKWEKKLMADVDDFLYIRKSNSEDAKIAGKLQKGDVAKILKQGKVWTKIQSGSVTGYVKNEFCKYGTKAYKLAKKVCDTYATVQTNGLRVRSKASENASVLHVTAKGDKLVVDEKAKAKDGWVAVTVGSAQGFVSQDYVDVALGTGTAISIEEELAQIEAQKQAQAQKKAQEQPQKETQTSGAAAPQTEQKETVAASADDLAMLAAIIYCEAGGESYEGKVAVGAVVMNRVRSSAFPNTIAGVIYQSGQFSPVASGGFASVLSAGSYQGCVAAAQAALSGTDNTGGAKYFHRANGAAGLVIGNHVFY